MRAAHVCMRACTLARSHRGGDGTRGTVAPSMVEERRGSNQGPGPDVTLPPGAARRPAHPPRDEVAETRPPTVGPTMDETRVGGPTAFITETRARSAMAFTAETRHSGAVGFVDAGAEPAVPVGGRIGRFVVLRELGRGAMGVVYAAYDEELDRKVAIKLLHAGRGADASQGHAMLLREAQAMARLAHPNVVAVHEVGVLDGAVFVAMEHVAGVDLQRWLAAARRPWRDVLAVLRQAGEGLVAAHREGLVHRDFKPSNVLVGDDGRVRVADFGLAARRSGEDRGPLPSVTALTETLSGEGALIGTPVYMAPELLRGAPATPHSDQYAYCVALHEALVGARPFQADDLRTLALVVERRELPTTSPRADLPAWLYAAIRRGLAKAPGDRWPSLAALVELLARDPGAERLQRRRRALQILGAIAATAAIVATMVIAYGALRRHAAEQQAQARLAGLREQIAALRARGETDEAARLLQTFVTLPEHRGTAVIARAHLEWAAAQSDHTAAVDAYASAYIAAQTPADGQAALLGLIHRLSAGGQVAEAAAALAVLEREAPDHAAAPELQGVRLAAALARRDLPAAVAALASGDPGGWSPVLEDLSHVTELDATRLGPADLSTCGEELGHLTPVDFDGDGVTEVIAWADGGELHVLRREPGLAPLRTIAVGPARGARAVAPVVAGEPLIVASHAVAGTEKFELSLLTAAADGTTRTIDAWQDSRVFHPLTLDFDGDGQRELYIGTEAYARKLWRMERTTDGSWSRRTAHRPTETVRSDLVAVVAADFEGDGRPELVVAAGPWRAYDVRVYRPTPTGELDQVTRRSFGAFTQMRALRVGDRDVVAFIKTDAQIAPDRFPADAPLGEPAGLYVIGLGAAGIEVLGHMPQNPESGPRRHLYGLYAGDLDGDARDELVVEVHGQSLALLRWRAGQPLEPLVIAGLRPLMVDDLDGDGTAEIVAAVHGEPGRLLVLGAGDATLRPLPSASSDLRAVPAGITDPAIAAAWTRAEHLVAIGLPRRTAGELAAIARLAGPVAPDMLLRTGELYAAVGEDALAAEHFVAAATRPDIAPAALAGAAQARLRLGEFAAAEALTRQRLDAVAAGERAAVEAELAALAGVTAARPEQVLTFTRPLDGRWRFADPVALRRSLARGELSVWASPTAVAAEYPLMWDGGPAALEVELETDVIEWGAQIAVEVVDTDDRPWLAVSVGGFGASSAPRTHVFAGDREDRGFAVATAPRIRGRFAVVPAFDTAIQELEVDGSTRRRVWRTPAPRPPPGPLRLRVTTKLIEPGYVAHAWIRRIRLEGLTAGGSPGPEDADHGAARSLVEGDPAAAAAALASAAPDSLRAVWRIEALLGLGDVAAATRAMTALLASAPTTGPVYMALYQRLRRGDPLALLAARAAFGPRMIDLLLEPGNQLAVRPGDVEAVLAGLPATSPTRSPDDPEALQRLVLTEFTRGAAHELAGQLPSARAELTAALARIAPDRPFELRDALRTRLLERLLAVAVAMGDREAAMQWARARVDDSETPYLVLERMQGDPAVMALLGADTLSTLAAEVRASRP